MGIPLPAATQWEIVEEAAQPLKPARDELILPAAQCTVVHNDDSGMRVLKRNGTHPPSRFFRDSPEITPAHNFALSRRRAPRLQFRECRADRS